MRILVTGASGFTGRHFVKLAQQSGHECVGLSNQSAVQSDVPVLSADLTDKASLLKVLQGQKFDAVVHLAAISFVAHGNIEEIYQTNLVGTINLIDAVNELANNPVRYLVASSGNIYGNATTLPITEQSDFGPANDYAASKCAMEMALKVRSQNSDITIVRPFNYTGRGQAEHFLVPKIVAAFKRNQKQIELGNLDVSRDFSDVRDVVSAYMQLLQNPGAGDVYNICSGVPVSLARVIEELEELAGYKIEVAVNPEFVRKNEVKELYGSAQKLESVIGRYRKYSLKDTLAWMLDEPKQ